MRIQMLRAAAVLISCAVIGSAMSQTTAETNEIVVSSSRMMEKTTKTAYGRITKVTLSYTISAGDLTSQGGKAKFEKAVDDAAWRVCKELAHQFPDGSSQAEKCQKQAKNDAMPRVRELEAYADKGATGK